MKGYKHLPTDDLYQHGIPVELNPTTSDTDISDRPALKDKVNWDTPVDTADSTRKITGRVATLRHYRNASNLLLCDHLWQQDHDAPLPFIITEIAHQTVDEMTLWGKYMVRIDGGGTVPKEMKDLYHCLFTEDDPVTTLLGMITLNMMARRRFLELRDDGDALFNAIATTLADDMDTRFSRLIDPYQKVVGARSLAERETMLATIASYIDHAGSTVRHNHIDFPTVNGNEEQRWPLVGAPVKQFYSDIRLTDGIL